ncbi:hypothetical protein O3P69_007751 [Scylla paramamosain]|uniref:Uncharacterized protein n=1 Tax=Scylla paramamosain TaxID=85552 RepID=A0AAW0V090_SCYPA
MGTIGEGQTCSRARAGSSSLRLTKPKRNGLCTTTNRETHQVGTSATEHSLSYQLEARAPATLTFLQRITFMDSQLEDTGRKLNVAEVIRMASDRGLGFSIPTPILSKGCAQLRHSHFLSVSRSYTQPQSEDHVASLGIVTCEVPPCNQVPVFRRRYLAACVLALSSSPFHADSLPWSQSGLLPPRRHAQHVLTPVNMPPPLYGR